MHDYDNIIGQSEVFKYVLYSLEQIAPTDTTVLILGESGTGKELIARALRHGSKRKDRPLIKMDCAALPDDLNPILALILPLKNFQSFLSPFFWLK